MKNLKVAFLLIGCSIIVNSCKKKEKDVNADLSVHSQDELIIWDSPLDLESKIHGVINFNYGIVPTDEVETKLIINKDSSELVASLNFKPEHREKYFDPDISNNTMSIKLMRQGEVQLDNSLRNSLTSTQECDLIRGLANKLPVFNFSSAQNVCVPLAFHIPDGIIISLQEIDNIVRILNNNFMGSKISFNRKSINRGLGRDFFNLRLHQKSVYPDEINTLNIYVSRALYDWDPSSQKEYILNGKALFPTEVENRVFIRDQFLKATDDPDLAVLTHEIGHFFSLFHTFETAADNHACNSNGVIKGDGCDDTPSDFHCPFDNCNPKTTAAGQYGTICPNGNTGFASLVKNFMSYSMNSIPKCNRFFSPLQKKRMRFAHSEWKSYLTCSGTKNEGTIELNGNLSFGELEKGLVSATKSFLVRNSGNQSFNISNIAVTSGFEVLNGQSRMLQPGEEYYVSIRFRPTEVKLYSGIVTVYNNADNATSGYSTISVSGIGVSSSSGTRLTYSDYRIDDDDSGGSDGDDDGIVESGEEIEMDVLIRNIGTSNATSVEAVLSTNDNYISISDSEESYENISSGSSEWNKVDFDFKVASNCPTKTVTFNLKITSDQGTWNESFTINVKNSSSSSNEVVPTNSCSNGTLLQLDKTYTVTNLNTGIFSKYTPIDGYSSNGGDIRGFWFRVSTPSSSNVRYRVVISDVSSNFNPVVGMKSNCSTSTYLGNTNSNPIKTYADKGALGGSETFITNLPNGTYGIRMYNYNGAASPAPVVSFKIRIELD